MIRRTFRFGLLLGLLGGAAFLVAKMLEKRQEPTAPSHRVSTGPWPRLATDAPLVPDPAAPSPVAPVVEEAVVEPGRAPAKGTAPQKKAPVKAWVEPKGGVCPTSHPVKAKLTSKIFHLPGMTNYQRTNPDRCYVDGQQAEADGLRAAKR